MRAATPVQRGSWRDSRESAVKMFSSWLWAGCALAALLLRTCVCQKKLPPVEYEHQRWWLTKTTPSPMLDDGEKIADPLLESPDFREEEPLHVALTYSYREVHRPYRISPHYRMSSRFDSYDRADNMGCACCTVYRRLTPLGGCAVVTSRHFLTTASSLELVLRGHRHLRSLENILGVWYDHNMNVANSSFYASISRIHYHPEFQRPHLVNRSHPLPVVFDLAVMASTFNVYGYYLKPGNTRICPRGTSSSSEKSSATPKGETMYAVGYQFIWAFRRVPTPFHKYFVRSKDYTVPCPKKEWGWFICIQAYPWARHGMDSGGTLFRTFDRRSKRWEGLVGMHTVAMKLRAPEINLYYTVLDSYPVLDFLYLAYMGRQPYEYLDYRFEDTQWGAPRPHPWAWIKRDYTLGDQWDFDVPFW